jgi:PAS domain S-box-containing protein
VTAEDEDELLRSVALQNAASILAARRRAEEELVRTKEALERKTEELAHSLSMMLATLECTTDGIVVIGDDGRVTGFNENFVRMWGLSREQVEGWNRVDLLNAMSRRLRDPEGYRARVDEIRGAGLAESFDVIELYDGRVFERYSKIQHVADRVAGRVWGFRDITGRRRAEEERAQLLESERAARAEAERTSAMKDSFLATLSHELRSPLGAILGWATLLSRRIGEDSDLRQGIEAIERNARVQTRLIEDLLDMSRIASGKLLLEIQPVDLAPLVEAALDAARPAAESKGIRLAKLVDEASITVAADPHRMHQVLWNLLTNAIKFTPAGGTLQVMLHRTASHAEVSVADTGVGIGPEFLPLVFERFRQADESSTRRYGGLGLGLAIVKNLVELHGGQVRAASAGEGQGTTFTVVLPLALQPPLAATVKGGGELRSFAAVDLGGIKVLLVEDDADARDLISRILRECGAIVSSAADAEHALALVRADPPDVLVSDIGMPDVDGYELLRRVRAMEQPQGRSIPAVALTAFASVQDRTRALRAGFVVHVSKPVDPTELVRTVARLVPRPDRA